MITKLSVFLIGITLSMASYANTPDRFLAEEAAKLDGTSPSPASTSPALENITEQLTLALAKEGLQGDVKVTLLGKKEELLATLANGDAEIVSVEVVNYNKRNYYLSGLVHYLEPLNNEMKTLKIYARCEELVDVPVLAARMFSGDVIGEDDIAWEKLSKRRLTSNTILKTADLLGKTPKRSLVAGVPINRNSIGGQVLVKRKHQVTVVYRSNTIFLASHAIAMEDGAQGDVIRVQNPDNKRPIYAKVESNDRVVVLASQPEFRMANNE